jgi:hypothetical protein
MAEVPQPVMNTVGAIVKLVAQILLVQKAIQSVIALKAGVTGMLGATAASATAAGTAAGGAATKVNMLKGAMLGLLRFGLVTLAIEIVVSGLGKLAEVQARMNAITKGSTKQFAEQVGGSATSRQEILNLQKQNREERARRVEEEKSVRFPMLTAQDDIARQAITQLDTRFAQLQTMGERARFATPADRARADATSVANAMNTPTPTTATGTGTGAKKGSDDAERAAEQMQQQLKAADDINFALKNRLAITQETEAVAKRMIEFDVRQNEIAKEYDELKKAAKGADELALINANQIIEQRIAQIEAERDINELLAQRILMADVMRQAGMPTVYNELEEQDAALQAVLDKYPAIGAAADAAATLATSGISEMIAGTKSAEQVFVDFLSSIADALINTAKQMIAQYIALGIARMFAMGSSPGGFAPSGPLAAVGNIGTGFNFDAGAMITPFAQGGFVTGPTNAVIGEGGESEYVIPSSKMDAAMSRYSRGARGEGVIAGSGGSDSGDTAAAAGPIVVDVRYSVERINDVEYVTSSQFQAGLRQAAQQGAAQGEQRTLRRLQQSPSTRKRVGV